MRKHLRSGFLFVFPITCLIACLVIFMIAQTFHLDNSHLSIPKAADFNNGWSLAEDETIIPLVNIPRSLTIEKGSIVLKNTLPAIDGSGSVLCFKTNSETVRVKAASREIYSYGLHDETPFGHYYGNVWIMVPLDESLSGQEISVELTAQSDEVLSGNYNFYLDQRGAVILTLVANNLLVFCNGVICLACAFLLLLSAFLHIREGQKVSRMRVYLGVFTLLGQLWALSDTGLLQLCIGNKAVAYVLTHSTFMLMPVPFLLYLSELFPRWEKNYRSLSTAFCVYYLARLLLYVSNVLELNRGVTTTHALIVVSICYIVILSLSDPKEALNRITLYGLFLFFGFVFLTILAFYLIPERASGHLNYTLVLSLGIDVLLLFFYSALLKSHVAIASHASRFEHQAYTDAMTQVKNRAAFNLEIEHLDSQTCPRLTLFMVDLNNLKQVNDTLGHPTGDKLICDLVNCLEGAFGGLGNIYRYGGDEFVVIIKDASMEDVTRARERFDQLVLQHAQRGGCEISVAVGMSSRMDAQYDKLHVSELLHLADMAMYRLKARQKNAPATMPGMRHHWMEQIDAATGILTFTAFKARVYEALAAAENEFPCIVNFDLNFFDGYNNLFGWDAGNQLLQKLTAMAMNLCGKKGFCAHGDADSFWVFADAPDLETLTRRITDETKRFQNQLGDCLLFPSFGIYCINEFMSPVSDMCSRATSAKKTIKGHFDVLYAVYNAEEHLRRIDNMKLTSYMHKGLDSDEFTAFYQPKFSPDGKHLMGAEALVRWSRASGLSASPAEFTELFEQSGLILAMDWYMLEQTCIFLRRQLDNRKRCVPISTNFSRLHVYEEDCVDRMRRLVNSYHLPHNLIEIEFTETALVQNSKRMLHLISQLRQEDFIVTLDDFGNGLSSLGILNTLSVDVIKVDRALLWNSTSGDLDTSVLEFVLSLCRHLNIHTVVEGVETKAQFDMLGRSECDMLQGNFLAPAMSEADFETVLAEHQAELADRTSLGKIRNWFKNGTSN